MIDDEEEIPEFESCPSRPWSWVNAAGIAANFGANMARSFTAFWEDVSVACGQHVAVVNDRADAIASLHHDLESL